ncbi:MAG: alpha/beta fold hydrolase [Acidimicrobiales bacterium]
MSTEYDLLPKLEELHVPTLVVHGEDDFVPLDCVAPIVAALHHARLVVVRECGHFSYLERPEESQREVAAFLRGE